MPTPEEFPKLTIDTLAFAIALDMLYDPNNHDEFDLNASDYEALVSAVYDDIADMIHNGNQDDWLLNFYENDGSTEGINRVSMDLQAVLHMDFNTETGMDRTDYGRHAAALQELADKTAAVIWTTKAGIAGRFGFAQ